MGRGESTGPGRVHTALLVAQVLAGGSYVVTKVAPVQGMHPMVQSVYCDALAAVILFSAALLLERHNSVRLSRSVVAKLLLLGLIGVFGSQFLLLINTERPSAKLSSALQPSIPVFTAIIAISFGVEKLNLRRRDSQAKLAGVTLCCAGAILMALYRGPSVLGWLGAALQPDSLNQFRISDWNLGALCLIGSGLCISLFINLQATLLKQYPAPLSVLAYSYLFGAVIMGVSSYFLVHDPSAWMVDWNADLLALLYNGIILAALSFGLTSWALSKVGPLFVASYFPVQQVSSVLLAAVVLNSRLYLGSVLGTVLIVLGLLLVSWAREEAMRLVALSRIVEQSSRVPRVEAEAPPDPELRTPLLQV